MFDPKDLDNPTVPYGYRPMAGPGGTNAVPQPYARPDQSPPALPRPLLPPAIGGVGAGNNPFDDVLDRVERDWSSAMDQNAPQQQTPAIGGAQNARATPFVDHVLTQNDMGRWRDLVGEVGSRLGVPPDVGMALVETVSGGRPDYQAGGGQALGLTGVPRAVAPGTNLADPTANLTVGLARLRSEHDRLGDWDRAALAATGFGDQNGQPRIVGPGADGFRFRDRFQAARRQHAPREV